MKPDLIFVMNDRDQFVDLRTDNKRKQILAELNEDFYYIYDKEKKILVLLEFGLHFMGILFLLWNFYGLKYLIKENIKKYRDIINNNFIVQGAFKDTDQYIYDLIKDGNWYYTEVVDEKTNEVINKGKGWNYDAILE